MIDSPDYPSAWRAIGEACVEQLALFRAAANLNWTYLSPPDLLQPGIRTGTYRRGVDHLVTAADGNSSISLEDFVVALLDEAENPTHLTTRFTVGY